MHKNEGIAITMDAFEQWIGREETSSDVLSPEPQRRLAAILDEAPAYTNGSPLPPLGHWMYFLPHENQRDLGLNGHAHNTDHLPPMEDLPRRMWAGVRVEILHDLPLGERAERRSTVVAIKEKLGASGRLLFVTFRHEIGLIGKEASLIEEQDVLFLGPTSSPRHVEAPSSGMAWQDEVTTDPVLLFRFSALTFNPHRIHYDHLFATEMEGYPGLVVHAPLVATMLARRTAQRSGNRHLVSLSFKAVSPAFVNAPLSLRGSFPDSSGKALLWAATEGNRLIVEGEARFA
ncbi:acyl-CoA dehydrogenase (plasmid) [Rhizobium sophoriradicis]|uniref:acyl-CoA dehydrogenase n=1 Tax=Rhizobium sophoriradicis TaxID=1535245 RepID=UPI00161ED085|nr:acyl-CoA dehydrogenase [Rhizobium leguminosarum bv. phaseoli]